MPKDENFDVETQVRLNSTKAAKKKEKLKPNTSYVYKVLKATTC